MEQENEITTKKRHKGKGSIQSERKKRRSQGKEYYTKKNIAIMEKQPPKLEVLSKV